MEAECVHDRLGAPAGAVPSAHVREVVHRRRRDVRPRVAVVVAARREADPDHLDLRVRPLQHVVGGREQPFVDGAGDRPAAGVVLGLPEAPHVPLVPDDVVGDGGEARDERPQVRQVLRRAEGAARDRSRLARPDLEDDLDVVAGRGLERLLDHVRMRDPGRIRGIEGNGDGVLLQAERRGAGVEVLGSRRGGRELPAVVSDAEASRGRRRSHGQADEGAHERFQQERLHPEGVPQEVGLLAHFQQGRTDHLQMP